MKVINKVFEVTVEQYYQKHFQIMSIILDKSLTPKEVEILSQFLIVHKDFPGLPVFSPENQRRVKDVLKLGNNLPTYLKSLQDKGWIFFDDNSFYISPNLIPDFPKSGYVIKMYNNEDTV